MKNSIIVGNIYKPPNDNNNCDNVKGFVSELELILSDLNNTNSEVLICGDYNINLLKIKGAVSYRFSQGLLTLMCNNSELKADINFFFFLLRRQTS